jgi:CDGSH-type Zn-finger protein
VPFGDRDVGTTKPFCDGTHSLIGFEGAMAAVERAD